MTSALALPSEDIAEICRRYAVKELALFGSAVRGEMTAESDVDLLVEFQPRARIGLVAFGSMTLELEKVLGRRVDLVTKPGLKPRLRSRILSEAQVVYAA